MLNPTNFRAPTLAREVGFSIILVLAAAAAVACDAGNPSDDGRGDRDPGSEGYFSAAELVNASQAIVIGRVGSQRDESFEFKSDSTGELVAVLTENVTTVEVTSVLKGEMSVGEVIGVVQTAQSTSRDRVNADSVQSREVLKLSPGEEFVFFLRRVVLPPGASGNESSTWGRPGEPGFARLEGDILRFVATASYRSAVASRELAIGDYGAPFELDLPTLEAMAAER
jgi:hypothetical protein